MFKIKRYQDIINIIVEQINDKRKNNQYNYIQ